MKNDCILCIKEYNRKTLNNTLFLYLMLQVSDRIHVVHNYRSNYGCIRCNIYLHLAIQCYYGSKIRELHPWHLNIMKLQSKIMHPNILFSLSLRICKIVPRNSYHSSQNEYIHCGFMMHTFT